jgi:quercetin dioxygenase-like cupin family protein
MSDSTTTPTREFVLGGHARASILTSGAETGGRHDITYVVEPAGAMTPLHIHTRYAERLWVQDGSMTVWAGSDVQTLRAGDFYTIEMDVPHTIQVGPDGVRGLNISSPAGFAELIARAGTPAQLAGSETELDMDRFAAVAAELGDVILGPPGTTPADR